MAYVQDILRNEIRHAGLPFAFVTIECSQEWIGVPDVRFEQIAAPVTNIEPGGTGTDKVSHHFLQKFKEPLVDSICFEFIFQDGQYLIDQWEGAQIRNELYIAVPNDFLSVGIKEGFVSLLDYAEESLKVTSVILCIPTTIKDREMVLRAFRALGLQLLNPAQVTALSEKDDVIFMMYEIN